MTNATGQIGIAPVNLNRLAYVGNKISIVPVVSAPRDPTGSDTNYLTSCEWVNTDTLDIWKLFGFISGVANWKKIGTGSVPGGTVLTLSDNAGTKAFPDGLGNIQISAGLGITVTKTADSQLTVGLVGGGNAIETIAVDANTAPGTNPVVPVAGQITITGAQVASGVIGANVIRTNSLAANTFTIQIQRSTAVAAADLTKNGVSHFNSASGQFVVDANGFVSVNGSGLLKWVNQTVNLSPLAVNTAYEANKGTLLTVTLPTTGVFGDTIRLQGFGVGGWILNAGTGQTIIVGSNATTVAGSVASTNANDYIEVVCSSTTTTWFTTSHGGNLTVS